MEREARHSGSAIDLLWAPRSLIAAIAFGEALAAVLVLASPAGGWVAFGLASLAAQWILLLTLAVMRVARRPLGRLRPVVAGGATLVVLLACTVLVFSVAAPLLPRLVGDAPAGWVGFTLRALGIVSLVGLLGLVALHSYQRAQTLAVRAKQADLDVLHARIRPHFLFNTLNTAAALVHRDASTAERVLLDLSDLFRAALGKHATIALDEELALTRRYLDIEALRFGDRLVIDWTAEGEFGDVQVPPLCIQPLVENAVRHGIERSRGGGVLAFECRRLPDRIAIRIANPLPDADAPPREGHGVGLSSSIARIEELTGGRGEVSTGVHDGKFVTRVSLPLGGSQVTTR